MSARATATAVLVVATVAAGVNAAAQTKLADEIAELTSLQKAIKSAENPIRTDALHRVWRVGVTTKEVQVKRQALTLLGEPAGSGLDQIRMPAMVAISEIARSTSDSGVRVLAIAQLQEPLQAEQVPIRVAAVGMVEAIAAGSSSVDVAKAAVNALGKPTGSGNNAVRMPAMMSLVRIVGNCTLEAACVRATELLLEPLKSQGLAGSMEVRMLAVVAMEQIAMNSASAVTKGTVIGLLQSESSKSHWEPAAKARVDLAISTIKAVAK